MKVAIVILNWNGESLLETYLPSVVANSPKEADIYIADNNSSDNSLEYVRKNYPSVKLIELDQNYGFAGGYNKALKEVDAEIYVLLNSDVEVAPNWIDEPIQKFKQSPNIAAIQPKILSYKDKSKFEYAGAGGGFIDKWGYTFCRGRLFHVMEEDIGQYDEASEIFWASGASLFIRSEVYHKVDGLDSDFFAHMEEIDLCWRIKNLGYEIWYEPKSTIYHLGGGTLNEAHWRKTFLNFRNNLFLIIKNDHSSFFILKLFYRLILDGISALKFLLDGNIKHSFAVLIAHLSLYKYIFKMFRKRSSLKSKSVNPNLTGFKKTSVVWSFFIKKKKKFSDIF